MGIEAFVWPYENGEPAAFSFSAVLGAFGDLVASWEPEFGSLHLRFTHPPDTCDVYCGRNSAETGLVESVMISRPTRHPELWKSVLSLMSQSHSFLFFSDDTTPLVWDLQSVRHFPQDLIADLGEPACVKTPDEILALHER